jgi:hypothetical protein
MLGQDAQADNEPFRLLAIEERPGGFQERAGAEQRLETGRRGGLIHVVHPDIETLLHRR